MTAHDERATAVRGSLVRTLALLPLWVFRLAAAHLDTELFAVVAIDLALVVGHWWAVTPLRRFERDKFPSLRQHATQLWLPFALALFLVVRDLLAALGRS